MELVAYKMPKAAAIRPKAQALSLIFSLLRTLSIFTQYHFIAKSLSLKASLQIFVQKISSYPRTPFILKAAYLRFLTEGT